MILLTVLWSCFRPRFKRKGHHRYDQRIQEYVGEDGNGDGELYEPFRAAVGEDLGAVQRGEDGSSALEKSHGGDGVVCCLRSRWVAAISLCHETSCWRGLINKGKKGEQEQGRIWHSQSMGKTAHWYVEKSP